MTAGIGLVVDLLDLSDERDQAKDYALEARREGWLAGREDGYRMGRADEARERDQAWNQIARPISRSGPAAYAETERRRWTVRGEQRTREDFGREHPDDFKGRGA